MGRACLLISMAFCAISGVVMTFNIIMSGIALVIHPAAFGPQLWATIPGILIATPFAAGFLAVAIYLRRHLRELDARLERAEQDGTLS